MKKINYLFFTIFLIASCSPVLKHKLGKNKFTIIAQHKDILATDYNENTSPKMVCLKEMSAFELREHKLTVEYTYPRKYLGYMLGRDTAKLQSLTDKEIEGAIKDFYKVGRERLETRAGMRDSILNEKVKIKVIEEIDEENATATVDINKTFMYYLRRDAITRKWRIVKYDRY